jgi:hypothetical protein
MVDMELVLVPVLRAPGLELEDMVKVWEAATFFKFYRLPRPVSW